MGRGGKVLVLRGRFLAAVFLLVLGSLQANAQNRFKFFSTFARDGVVPAECLHARALIRPLVEIYDHPSDWTWVIACDEPAWFTIQTILKLNNRPGTILAATNRNTRSSFLRGARLLAPEGLAPEERAEHVVVHELGHIMLRTADEGRVEAYVERTLRDHARMVAQAGTAKKQAAPDAPAALIASTSP